VKLLLERGADIETRDDGGKTPLSSAAFPGRVDVVQVLLDSGADIETRDDGGKTLLKEYRFGVKIKIKYIEQVYQNRKRSTRRTADIPSYFPALA